MTHRVTSSGRYVLLPRNPILPLKAIILLHGYNADAQSASPAGTLGTVAKALADAGYLVVATDAGGLSTWANDTSIAAVAADVAYAQGTLAAASGKVGLFAYSMGGAVAFNYAKANPSKVACIGAVAPVSDLGWQHDSGGNGTAIDTAYSGSYATNGTAHSPSAFPASLTGFPVKAWQGANDVNVSPTTVQSLVTAVNAAGGTASYVNVGAYDHTTVFGALDLTSLVAFFKASL